MFARIIETALSWEQSATTLLAARGRLTALAAVAIAVVALMGYLVHTGYKMCEGNAAAGALKGVETHENTKSKVYGLADSDLYSHARVWVRP